jgi:hypothetical protein
MEETLHRALARLSAASSELEAAQQRVSAAAREVAEAITARSAEGAGDRELGRALYWDYPDVPVPVIGALLGVAANRVAGVVGVRVVERPCVTGCGRMAAWTMRSRNESTRPSTECETCAEARGDPGFPRGWTLRPIGS